jgi:hypothetical protein
MMELALPPMHGPARNYRPHSEKKDQERERLHYNCQLARSGGWSQFLTTANTQLVYESSVADMHHLDADPDPACHF